MDAMRTCFLETPLSVMGRVIFCWVFVRFCFCLGLHWKTSGIEVHDVKRDLKAHVNLNV